MPQGPLTIEQVLTLLVQAPPRLAELTAGLKPAQLRTTAVLGEWSAVEVLAHLRACADVWGTCIATTIAEDEPTLKAVNPRAWITKTDYPELDFLVSLHSFTAQRAELVAVLESLPDNAWSRTATVTGAGKILERSVLFYARWLARHERQHIKQIERLVNTVRL